MASQLTRKCTESARFKEPRALRRSLRTQCAFIFLVSITMCVLTRANGEKPPATSQATFNAAEDVALIAKWLTGSELPDGTVERAYGGGRQLTEAKDSIFFTDVEGVTLPPGLRSVPYDFFLPRRAMIRGGHKVDPAVVVARSVAGEPVEGGAVSRKIARRVNPGERYYFVEVAYGNLASQQMKVIVYDLAGQPRIEIVWSTQS